MIQLDKHDGIAEIRIQHAKELNPFSVVMTRGLISVCEEVERDDTVDLALIWGGPGRAFSVGGDFQDIRAIPEEELAGYLGDIVRSYQALLGITKPLLAGLDRFAIGQGLQVALMADWRVATMRTKIQMPELANGVPCPLGSLILEVMFGRAAMMNLVVGCQSLDAEAALRGGMVNELCEDDVLEPVSLERLERFRAMPSFPYRTTKRIHNARFSRALGEIAEEAGRIHAQSFRAGNANEHFSKVLGEGA